MTVCDLFAGIGGFSLGLQRAGMTIKYQVEIDGYCNRVLEKHWPNVARSQDIKKLRPEEVGQVDLVCGGFPCQPVSVAGKRRGKEDDRWLWPEMLRIIKGVRPSWVLGENTTGIINMGLDEVLSDLEGAGYSCQSFTVPACAVDAPHRRERVWIVAHASQPGLSVPESQELFRSRRWEEGRAVTECRWWPAEPGVGRMASRVPGRVDRLKALGNAVVPQVVEQIGKAIMYVQNQGK